MPTSGETGNLTLNDLNDAELDSELGVVSVRDLTAEDVESTPTRTVQQEEQDVHATPSQRPDAMTTQADDLETPSADNMPEATSDDHLQMPATESEPCVEEEKEVIGTAVVIEKEDDSTPSTPQGQTPVQSGGQTPVQSGGKAQVSSSPAVSAGSGSPMPAFIPILTSPPRPSSLVVGNISNRSTPRSSARQDVSHPPCVPVTPDTPPVPVSLTTQLSVSTVGYGDSGAPTPVPASGPTTPESGNLNLQLSESPSSDGSGTPTGQATHQLESAVDAYPNGPPSNRSDATVAYEDLEAPSPFSPQMVSPNGGFQSPRLSLSRTSPSRSSGLGSPNILATPLPRQVEDPIHAPSPMPASQSSTQSSTAAEDLDDEELEHINANVFQRPSGTSSGRRKAGSASSPKTPASGSLRQRPDPVHMPTPMHSAVSSPARSQQSSTRVLDVAAAVTRAREERLVSSPVIGSPASPYISMTPSPELLPNPLENMTEEEVAERERQQQLEESGRQRILREVER